MKYDEVPFIITGKDLDYLSDAFNWEYGAYKAAVAASDSITDEKLSKHALNVSKMHNNHMIKILEILKEAQDESSK